MNIPANASTVHLKWNLLTTIGYFLAAYIVVTILTTAFAFTLIRVLKFPGAAELGSAEHAIQAF